MNKYATQSEKALASYLLERLSRADNMARDLTEMQDEFKKTWVRGFSTGIRVALAYMGLEKTEVDSMILILSAGGKVEL
jgi:pimeloyl-ACP methyl ester carboxylesterase